MLWVIWGLRWFWGGWWVIKFWELDIIFRFGIFFLDFVLSFLVKFKIGVEECRIEVPFNFEGPKIEMVPLGVAILVAYFEFGSIDWKNSLDWFDVEGPMDWMPFSWCVWFGTNDFPWLIGFVTNGFDVFPWLIWGTSGTVWLCGSIRWFCEDGPCWVEDWPCTMVFTCPFCSTWGILYTWTFWTIGILWELVIVEA